LYLSLFGDGFAPGISCFARNERTLLGVTFSGLRSLATTNQTRHYKNLKHRGDESLEEGGFVGMLAPALRAGGFGRISNGLAVLLHPCPGLAEEHPGDQCIMPHIAQITAIKPGEFSLDNVAAFLK
jgi:hypothetical protein